MWFLSTYIKPSWRDVVDLRNIVAHEYFGINVDLIFDIVKKDVPKLENELIELVKNYPDLNAINWSIEQAKNDLKKSRRYESLEYLENLF